MSDAGRQPEQHWLGRAANMGTVTAALIAAASLCWNVYQGNANGKLQDALSGTQSQLEGSRTDVANLQRQVEALSPQLARLRPQVEQLTSQLMDAQKERKAIEEQNAALIAEVDRLRIRLIGPQDGFASRMSDALSRYQKSQTREQQENIAREIVKLRDIALFSVKDVQQRMSILETALDAEFDELNGVLSNPPISQSNLQQTLRKLSSAWPDKRKIIELALDRAGFALSCPAPVRGGLGFRDIAGT